MLKRLAVLLFLPTACFKGPGYLKQGAVEPQKRDVIIVATREENGASTGLVQAQADKPQVVKASDDSTIAGSEVEFPPGSVAIDTEITIKPGESIATAQTVQDLQLGTDVAAAAPAVAISSSVPMDAAQPFTVAIPIPDASGLHLSDPYDNLVVMYRVAKTAENAEYSGVFTRGQITLDKGYARFSTKFFGTYQAVLTKELVTQAVETPAAPKVVEEKKPEPKPASVLSKVYYQSGLALGTFGDQTAKKSGLQAWGLFHSPAKVSSGSVLTTDYVAKSVSQEGQQ